MEDDNYVPRAQAEAEVKLANQLSEASMSAGRNGSEASAPKPDYARITQEGKDMLNQARAKEINDYSKKRLEGYLDPRPEEPKTPKPESPSYWGMIKGAFKKD